MNSREAHKIWIEQCEAAQTVRARFGVKAAFDYIVGEKLINFAEAASHCSAFAQELPRFISEVRRMFTPEETAVQLTRIEHEWNAKDEDVPDEDDPLRESPASIAERARQFMTIKELLTATSLALRNRPQSRAQEVRASKFGNNCVASPPTPRGGPSALAGARGRAARALQPSG